MNEEEGSEVDNDEEIEDEEYEESDNEPDAGETTSVLNGHNIDFTQLDGGLLCSWLWDLCQWLKWNADESALFI